jgi:hypothetical protein
MNLLSSRPLAALLLAAAVAVSGSSALLSANSGETSAIDQLPGRWVGNGLLVPANGPSLPFDCTVTYVAQANAGEMKQTLRCRSKDFKFEAMAHLVFDGERVTGRWEDKINEIDGPVDGKVTPTGFDIDLKGRYFQARMQVDGDACLQTVKVNPHRVDTIRELSADLKKC